MSKEKMLTQIIRRFGFEAKETIKFAYLMEEKSTSYCKAIFTGLMNKPITKEEEL